MAISAVGEGCYKQMEALLPDIVNTVLPFLGDNHPRVRYAACNAVGQLSTDFAPGFQKKFHTRVSGNFNDCRDSFHLFSQWDETAEWHLDSIIQNCSVCLLYSCVC